MSDQTKEQSIGYILKAMSDVGMDTKHIKNVYHDLDRAINEDDMMNNYSTYDLMIVTNRDQGLDDEKIKKIGSYLYGLYDMNTVGEAEGFYHSFVKVLK